MIKKYTFLLFILFTILLTSCFGQEKEFEYLGENPELFSIAVNSILGARGFQDIGWGKDHPAIITREKDNHGRILFSYSEGGNFVGLLVLQKMCNKYVYFYPHYNFILSSRENHWRFSNTDISSLKRANSWNQQMSDSSEFIRVRIVRMKEYGPISDNKLVEAYYQIIPDNSLRVNQILSNIVFLRDDTYGRAIYSFGRRVILFHPNHLFDIDTGLLEITDRYNYQTELRLFMEANGWDTPFEE